MPDTSVHPFRMALEKFWAPVPWMLEAAIVLKLVPIHRRLVEVVTGLSCQPKTRRPRKDPFRLPTEEAQHDVLNLDSGKSVESDMDGWSAEYLSP